MSEFDLNRHSSPKQEPKRWINWMIIIAFVVMLGLYIYFFKQR